MLWSFGKGKAHSISGGVMSCQEQATSNCDAPLKRNSRDVFKYMMTPDRIPEFIIPSLDILEEHRLFSKEKGPSWNAALGPLEQEAAQNYFNPFQNPSSFPCRSDTVIDAKMDDIPDPGTRAAFSLPHLPKITTPYGFMALGESPHVTKEEALFFQLDLACLQDPPKKRYSDPQVEHQRCADSEGTHMACVNVRLKDHHHVPKVNRPNSLMRSSGPIQSSSEINSSKATAAVEMDGLPKSLVSLITICPRSNSSPDFSLQRPKGNLFKKFLKKHFAHLWNLKTVKFPGH